MTPDDRELFRSLNAMLASVNRSVSIVQGTIGESLHPINGGDLVTECPDELEALNAKVARINQSLAGVQQFVAKLLVASDLERRVERSVAGVALRQAGHLALIEGGRPVA